MLTRDQKEEMVKSLKVDLQGAQAVFLTNVVGITSNASNDIRKKVRDSKGKLVVLRNTLFRRASTGTPYEKMLSNLSGPRALAIAFGDATGVAKALFEFGKDNEIVQIYGGVLDGKDISAKEAKELAQLPSKDQMIGTLLATFNAPISALARVLFAIQEKKQQETTV